VCGRCMLLCVLGVFLLFLLLVGVMVLCCCFGLLRCCERRDVGLILFWGLLLSSVFLVLLRFGGWLLW